MSDEIEQRHGYINLERLINNLAEAVKEQGHQMRQQDRDIAVLKTQMIANAGRTTAVETAIVAIHEKIDEVSKLFNHKLDAICEALAEHVKQENKDRIKLLAAVIATLVTGMFTLAFELLKRG